MSSEQMYKEKYLKYKKKYSTLKKQIDGGAGSSYFKQMVLATGSLGSQTSQGKRTVSNLFLKARGLYNSVQTMKDDLKSFIDTYNTASTQSRKDFTTYDIEYNKKHYTLSYLEILKFISLIHRPYSEIFNKINEGLQLDTIGKINGNGNYDGKLISTPEFPKNEISIGEWFEIATDINDNYASMTGSISKTRTT